MALDAGVYANTIIGAYEKTVDELLVNIAKHFDVTDATAGTVDWQIRKLSELGALTKENLRIIADNVGGDKALVEEALTKAAKHGINSIENALERATARGMLSGTETSVSERIKAVLEAFQNQAEDTLNLVNTTMLQSSLEAYNRGITDVVYSVKQLTAAQGVLNEETGQLVLGARSRQDAVRSALKKLDREGLTGYIDKSGRRWTPEAYVNMDLRTTMRNTYRAATFQRNADYGNDLVYAGIKAISREGGYPWQGKVLSMSDRSGYVTDLNGNKVPIIPISRTSYGQPAGLWGINCGHSCNVFIPGLSTVRGEIPDKQANDDLYEQTQTQRRLERGVRKAKRQALMADASHDKETFDEAAKAVQTARQKLSAWIDAIGHDYGSTPNRTAVYGYNKSISSRVISAARRKDT